MYDNTQSEVKGVVRGYSSSGIAAKPMVAIKKSSMPMPTRVMGCMFYSSLVNYIRITMIENKCVEIV